MSSETTEDKLSVAQLKQKRHRMSGFEEWGGYMAAKKMKLAAQLDDRRQTESDDHEETQTDIFKGVSIFINGYTKPSAEELKRLMLIHGGTYHHYYSTTKTTHIVASNLPYSKIKNLKNEIVVTPNWITDSIKVGKLLPHQDYLLYTPEALHKQQRLKFGNFIDSKATGSIVNNHQNSNNYISHPGSSLYDISEEDSIFPEKNLERMLENTSIKSKNFNNSSSHVPSDITKSSTIIPSKSEGPATAGQPGFLSEFYNHSRLHHISTAGQELKRYVQTLVDNHNSKTFSGREGLKSLVRNGTIPSVQSKVDDTITNDSKRNQHVIMHLDMDCFFVSVGLRKHPELRGKPVAVTHSKGKRGGPQDGSDIHFEASHYMNQSKKKLEGVTSNDQGSSNDELAEEETTERPKFSKYSKEYGSLSEIASCSYEARKCGVRNGMFLGEALRRCPNLKTIPYDFEGYSEVSKQLYDIVASYTLDIEAISCDELYIDCTELLQDVCISPQQFASVLRAEIEQKTGCTASAGLGSNMLVARLANRAAKPNGQYFVPREKVEEFMLSQRVKDLPGVGYSTSAKFENMGVISCGDLQNWSLSKLQQEFGPKTGQVLFNRCRGKDDRVVQIQKERKSVSAEINYGIRFEQEEEVYKFLKELSVEVITRLRNINCKAKSITLKLLIRHPDAPMQTAKFMGHGVCDHISKSVLLKSATDDPTVVGNECCTLARSLKIKPEDYRGIGIQLSKLEPVQKDTRGHKRIESFLAPNAVSDSEDSMNREIFAPKGLEPVNKPLPKGGSIKDFLGDKPSPIKKTTSTLPAYQTPSMDEIDQSVLNALPEDLKREVLELIENNPLNRPAGSVKSSTTSSHHLSKPCSSKANKVASNKGASYRQTKNVKKPSKENTLLDCIESSKKQSDEDIGEESVLKRKATIGGAEDINEVRSLVKEWVLSSQVVLDEDVEQFKDYILQVIDEDLKKVDLILKYFYRVVSTANSLWQQAYLTVLSYVQQKMLQKYGTMLDAKSDFVT